MVPMRDTQLQVGQPVRYGDPHGSWGTISSPRHYDDGWYVRWNYGKDVKGEAITSLGSYHDYELIPVERSIYERYINCRAWSDEQKEVLNEIRSAT
jgi:hypothetical protein